jgi:DNA replication protein DnaC
MTLIQTCHPSKKGKKMSLTLIRTQMHELGLHGMLSVIETVLTSLQKGSLSFTEALDELLQQEKQERQTRATKFRFIRSKIRKGACLEEFDLTKNRLITKAQLRELSQLEWCVKGQPLILIGPTGVGKTYLARALGVRACEAGMSTLFMSVTELIENQIIARSCNGYLKWRDKLIRPDLLILDDFGMRKFTSQEAEDLRDIIEQRSYGKSTLFTTQLPFDHWGEVIGDTIILEALVDRLEAPGWVMKIDGPTFRRKSEEKKQKKVDADPEFS